ncbi:cholinesterase 2-like [Physella acuta]|uniref:cholinesterase 2-like n=1 Tax=Physella acuta TaxID=109671 RepID=UPI0027DDFC76|nr:cholinesterase 2-like [Physella acuta]XP_059158599.1 cholinesterase 2-like [Physella acuta]XP_059158600.1 cholinesterase 2-like [Physella acuta]XP_059158601.1 cholinesterase 2-like [Physella acuta]XP_059158602.1 cholinesterase 2-like [Physella acuta]XP_059158603.1 cholinesterase 2-like [Physella acuta]
MFVQIILLWNLVTLAFSGQERLVVQAPVGKILGLKETAVNGKMFWSFRGVRYAKPPLGHLRFAKPEPYVIQEEIFDATAECAACVQSELLPLMKKNTSEDCLFLNIFSTNPQNIQGQLKKVMIWIHGGGFIFGSASEYHPGSYVTDQDVIVVAMNYRLGVLGFLTTENEASSGNYGLWDQILAIQWVKSNIAAFGGDPDDITIAGESAGAAAVSILSLSSVTKGLFTKAYMQSGTALTLLNRPKESTRHALRAAKFLNCWDKPDDIDIDLATGNFIVDCLRKRSASEIANVQVMIGTKIVFVPYIDGVIIPKSPSQLLQDSVYLTAIGFPQRKYLMGINNNEASLGDILLLVPRQFIFNQNNTTAEEKDKNWHDFIVSSTRDFISQRLEADDISEDLLRQVYGWYDARYGAQSVFVQLAVDVNFVLPMFDILNTISSLGSEGRLLYFNHYPRYMKGAYRGTPHALDIAYLFDMPVDWIKRITGDQNGGVFEEEDEKLKKLFSSVIGDFVKTGNPEIATRHGITEGWPSYDPVGDYYLEFNLEPSIKKNLARDVRKLWSKEIPAGLKQHQHTHGEL